MASAFIWYQTDSGREPELTAWLEEVKEITSIEGKLYIRNQNDKTTFMESYADLSQAMIERIEKLAAKQAVFADIERHCESFQPIR